MKLEKEMGGAPATGASGSLGVREKPQGECAGCGEGGERPQKKELLRAGQKSESQGWRSLGTMRPSFLSGPPTLLVIPWLSSGGAPASEGHLPAGLTSLLWSPDCNSLWFPLCLCEAGLRTGQPHFLSSSVTASLLCGTLAALGPGVSPPIPPAGAAPPQASQASCWALGRWGCQEWLPVSS